MSQFWKPGAVPPAEIPRSASESDVVSSSKEKTKKSGGSQEISSSKDNQTVKLSNAVMSMKFMKRKGEEETIRQEDKAKRARLLDPQWSSNEVESTEELDLTQPRQTGAIEYIRDNENDIYSLFSGRRSFGGFNVQVEKYCQLLADDQRFEKVSKANISDEEMVNRYEKMTSLPRGSALRHDKMAGSRGGAGEGAKKKKKK